MRNEIYENGQLIRVEDDGIAPVFTVSKLKLRRTLRAAGLEQAFDSALDASGARADWDEAQELSTDDPMMAAMIPQFAASLGVSTDKIMGMLISSASFRVGSI